MKIVAIYDYDVIDSNMADRYTVITDEWDSSNTELLTLGCSVGGRAVSMFGGIRAPEHSELFNKDNGQYRTRTYLGKLVHFEQLDADTQKHIAWRIFSDD